jgi:hypothetical protein
VQAALIWQISCLKKKWRLYFYCDAFRAEVAQLAAKRPLDAVYIQNRRDFPFPMVRRTGFSHGARRNSERVVEYLSHLSLHLRASASFQGYWRWI